VALLPVAGSSSFESSAIAPGRYQVQVTGSYPYKETIDLKPESRIELTGWKAFALNEAESKKHAAEKALSSKESKTKAGYVTLSVGVLGSAGAVVTYFLGNAAKDAYNTAQTSEELAQAREQYTLMQSLFYGTAVAGGLGLAATPFLLTGQNPSDLEKTIRQLDEDIKALGGN
jgi:hypothetical protein